MTRKTSLHLAPILMAAVFGLALPLLACGDSGDRKLSEQAKDALDLREHEGLKDAGEDVQDAVKDAGDAVGEEVDSLKQKAK